MLQAHKNPSQLLSRESSFARRQGITRSLLLTLDVGTAILTASAEDERAGTEALLNVALLAVYAAVLFCSPAGAHQRCGFRCNRKDVSEQLEAQCAGSNSRAAW